MTLHNNRVSAALHMIAEQKLNPTDVERICGVNRTQIYRWKAGEVKDMRFDSFTKLADSLGYAVAYKNEQIEITPHTKKETGNNNMEEVILKDHIALQKEKIVALEDRILELEEQRNKMDSIQEYDYANCDPTFCSVNELKLVPFRMRTISIDKSYMELNKYLQAPEPLLQKAFEGDGQWHKWQDAPINLILSKKSSNYFINASKDLGALVSTWKTFIVERTMAQKVEYAYENNIVKTMVLTKLTFKKNIITTHSKSILMQEE